MVRKSEFLLDFFEAFDGFVEVVDAAAELRHYLDIDYVEVGFGLVGFHELRNGFHAGVGDVEVVHRDVPLYVAGDGNELLAGEGGEC